MSPSRPPAAGVFSGLFARGAAAQAVSDKAFVAAMAEVEAALVRALVGAGLAPFEALEELSALDAGAVDVGALGDSVAAKGTPVPALVAELRKQLGEGPAAAVLHRGATSQDVVDTALMLVAQRALNPLLADLAGASERCAELAERHRDTVQIGRTLLQQAVPLTFGLTAASWLSGLDAVRAELVSVRSEALAVQLGGAVGTLAPLGERGLDVVAAVARELGLAEPPLPWHTDRVRPARLASALGIAAGAMAKPARDVVLLAQTEVGELQEGAGAGRGGSSTMPHKRNPVGAVAVLACADRVPGLVATMLAVMSQEYQRGAGGWQAEWETLRELLRLTGSAAAALRELLGGLEVDAERMRANLELTHGLVMSESVAAALGDALGRPRAQELLEEATRRAAAADRSLADELRAVPEVRDALDDGELGRALDPASYLGVTSQLIDRALARHREIG